MNTTEQIRSLYSQGNIPMALGLLQKSLHSRSDDGRLWELCGIIQLAQREVDQALAALEKASLLVPLSAEGELSLAICYLGTGKTSLASTMFSHLVDREDVPCEMLPRLASLLGATGQHYLALAVCRREVEMDPENDAALFAMAHYMGKLGRPPELILSVLRKAFYLAPHCDHYRLSLALVLVRTRQDIKAYQLLSAMSAKKFLRLQCPRCVEQLRSVFARFGDGDRESACQMRLEELQTGSSQEAS